LLKKGITAKRGGGGGPGGNEKGKKKSGKVIQSLFHIT